MNTAHILLATAGVLLVILLSRISVKPLKFFLKLSGNSLLGFAGLILANHFGSYIGVSLGVNLVNSITLGLLGAPGFGLLLFLKWLCSV